MAAGGVDHLEEAVAASLHDRGWGAEIVSIVAEEAFGALTGPAIRITTPHIPLPAADSLADHVLPSVDKIVETVSKAL